MSVETPRERPILFNDQMVRAILEGRKTVTRRAVKDTGFYAIDAAIHGNEVALREREALSTRCPFGQPGDRLWVRETHAQVFEVDIPDGRPAGPIGTAGSPGRPDWKCRYVYRSDGEMPNVQWHHVGDSQPVRWTPSIHMPRRASRILLEITAVRVERLQDITPNQCIAEGAWREKDKELGRGQEAIAAFADLWRSTGGDWDANPWVWVVEFKRVTP
ncbi:hypothetical protein [Pseudomonas aeruginosa]|uniref:hypothetical protein n=1 Tax=Pseudomonas aeruginosa TaxID=287 RepID=UPI00053D13BA|nr:hypothetical protein [Pseudomonas aeruginosa]AYW39447.1 hypothetical protein DL351_07720 [Pseudomonas aeruginosa]EKU7422040.1 hypothetical protein [Pseudomonas aeruginosa]ELP1404657.1 hypothetical protein [Pseudomonas aeruginosa]KSG20880.1 hypothetical protein AO946_26635 [Pseudomonas aeruginosa]MBG6736841.1 hypothetical protein [Pseudomonas aeruginosa]